MGASGRKMTERKHQGNIRAGGFLLDQFNRTLAEGRPRGSDSNGGVGDFTKLMQQDSY